MIEVSKAWRTSLLHLLQLILFTKKWKPWTPGNLFIYGSLPSTLWDMWFFYLWLIWITNVVIGIILGALPNSNKNYFSIWLIWMATKIWEELDVLALVSTHSLAARVLYRINKITARRLSKSMTQSTVRWDMSRVIVRGVPFEQYGVRSFRVGSAGVCTQPFTAIPNTIWMTGIHSRYIFCEKRAENAALFFVTFQFSLRNLKGFLYMLLVLFDFVIFERKQIVIRYYWQLLFLACHFQRAADSGAPFAKL